MFCRMYLKKVHIRFIFLILIPLLFFYNIDYLNISLLLNTSQKHLISCYFQDNNFNSLLELNPDEVTKHSIFFVETSCNHKNGINLNLRQGCAIESAANLNPRSKVFVLFVASSFINKSDVINRLTAYKNVHLRHIHFVNYAYKTPLQEFVTSNKIFTSQWSVSHTSDLLRFLTLWKFGGTYLDLDVILMKSIEGINNFASAESNSSIASLILNFDVDDNIGETIANTTIYEFANNFHGDDWGYNGPGVITRALQKICNTNVIADMNYETCKGFMVYEPKTFCPINWMDWKKYFNENTSDEVMDTIKDSMGIHVWNLHSKHMDIIVGSKQPYGLIATKYCPNVFSLAKYVF